MHKWGFYGFGQIVGKSHIVEEEWDPYEITKVLIPDNNTRSPYYPSQKSDPAIEAVIEAFDVAVVVVK